MNPYIYVAQATERGESLLSLCCGIGNELEGLGSHDITAVDVVPEYLERINHAHPEIKTVCEDALKYIRKQPKDSVDIISIIDGIEHMEKIQGLALIMHMKRVAKKQILLFTPQGHNETGFVRNEPHHAWEIPHGDEYQVHKSGWMLAELQDLGFTLIMQADSISQHGDPYTALMVKWDK